MPMLQALVQGEVWGFLLIFLRLAAVIQLIPGIGEQAVPQRARLMLALILTLVMLPLLRQAIPAIPDNPAGLMALAGAEIGTGLLISLCLRLILSTLNTAGSLIAIQSGLAFIQTIDPTQGTQGSLVANFVSLVGLTAIFASDLYFLPIAAIHDSYTLFPPGHWPVPEDMLKTVLDTVAGSFRLGIQMAAPFIVFGIVFNTALGILARLIPAMQVSFIAQPAQIVLSFALLSILMGTITNMFLTYFGERLRTFLL